jgi:hypothetical protein
MRFPKLLLASLAFAVAACASTPKGGSSSDSASNTLTSVEIEKANVPTAYEAVDRLRRKWFRDMTGQGDVVVYMNNQKLGDGTKEQLRQIPAQDIASLEYLKGSDAVMRFGQDAKGGAIIVNRK